MIQSYDKNPILSENQSQETTQRRNKKDYTSIVDRLTVFDVITLFRSGGFHRAFVTDPASQQMTLTPMVICMVLSHSSVGTISS